MAKVEITSPRKAHEIDELVWNGQVIWKARECAPVEKIEFVCVAGGGGPKLEVTYLTPRKE